MSTDVKDSDDGGVASADASGENRDADGRVIADAARTLWGGLWGDVKSASRGTIRETVNPYGADEKLGGPPGEVIANAPLAMERAGLYEKRSRRSAARGNEGARLASKGAAATRKARAGAKKRAHKRKSRRRAPPPGGITGWAYDEESFFEYESVDGPFLPGASSHQSHQSHAPSFGDARGPRPRRARLDPSQGARGVQARRGRGGMSTSVEIFIGLVSDTETFCKVAKKSSFKRRRWSCCPCYELSLTPLGGGPARIGARAERVRLITARGTEARVAPCCARAARTLHQGSRRDACRGCARAPSRFLGRRAVA